MPIRACPRSARARSCRRDLAAEAAADLGATLADAEAYDAHRIALGVPRGGEDFIYGDAFPHEADMDQLAGVDFDKGCYVGQEVVSRVEHRAQRAQPRRAGRLDEFAPTAGLPVMAGEKEVGTLRLDRQGPRARAAAARPASPMRSPPARRSLCGNLPIRVVKPDWARSPGRARRKRHERSRRSRRRPQRCPWPKQDPLYVAYHDEEWGVPEYDDRALYEKLVLDGFQAGLSWITILRKRENFRRAFDDFEPEKIARYTPKQDRAADAGRRHRAQPRQDRGRGRLGARLAQDHGERAGLFRHAVGSSSTASRRPEHFRSRSRRCRPRPTMSRAMSKELRGRGFKFVGPTIVYAFMQAVGMVNDHLVDCHRHAAVRQARAEARDMSKARASQPRAKRVARLAAHAVGAPARSARPLAARRRDRGHRARARARRALERADQGRAYLLGRPARAAGRGAGARQGAAARRGRAAARCCCTTRPNT